MSYTQVVQLQDFEGDVVGSVELPAIAPTPRIIVLNGTAFERHIDLLTYRATSYFWLDSSKNIQRLVNDRGEQVWQHPKEK